MLIDDVKIKVKAGHGGCGKVAFNTSKMGRGPTGANGGNGGNIYLEGVSDISALIQFRYKKELTAGNGKDGNAKLIDGENGSDLILQVPIGTVVHNLSTQKDSEIIFTGQRLLIAKGGRGGKGNFKFRSSVNTSPMEFQEGLPGEEYELRLELKLIADVGFIGLPNDGASDSLTFLGIIVLKTLFLKCSFMSETTCCERLVLESNMVRTTPSIFNSLFILS